jgi:hypothetical protein
MTVAGQRQRSSRPSLLALHRYNSPTAGQLPVEERDCRGKKEHGDWPGVTGREQFNSPKKREYKSTGGIVHPGVELGRIVTAPPFYTG